MNVLNIPKYTEKLAELYGYKPLPKELSKHIRELYRKSLPEQFSEDRPFDVKLDFDVNTFSLTKVSNNLSVNLKSKIAFLNL